jgi:hypothetical protein
MKKVVTLGCLIIFTLTTLNLRAQESRGQLLDRLFGTWGEICFRFAAPPEAVMNTLVNEISIDNVRNDSVFAYANRKEFLKFLDYGIGYTLLPHPSTLLPLSSLQPANPGRDGLTTWNFYPTYPQYVSFMEGFASDYPAICKLIQVGLTVQGRQLLAVKISSNVDEDGAKPQFLYCSTIHGDEVTGYVQMLHLIDYLLSNYGVDPAVTNLVDSTEIFINPNHNPDGTYHGGDNTVYGAQRYNANNVDLNRNFPDPAAGQHPDGNEWQPETVAFMAFADSNHFTMGANFHGGSEVVNYPWDTWAKLTADDDWWQYISHEYADTAQYYGPAGYFSGFDDGITNGYAWYRITGGRQDYMNYWHGDREETIEMSNVKIVPTTTLLTYWDANYRSFLNQIRETHYGVQGIVTDTVTGEPLLAKCYIFSHDMDHSEVYSKLPSGFYSRYLYEGTYNITYSCPGYFSKVKIVSPLNHHKTVQDVQLVPLTYGIQGLGISRMTMVFPNPSRGSVRVMLPAVSNGTCTLELTDLAGRVVFSGTYPEQQPSVALDLSGYARGLYIVRVRCSAGTFEDRMVLQ